MSQPAAAGATPEWSWRPRRRTLAVLPVPTATELAAVRARVDGLEGATTRRARTALVVVVFAAVVALLAVDLVAACGLVGTVGLVLGVVTALPTVLREAGAAPVLPAVALLGVFLAAAAGGIHALRSDPVGAGPVLEAVDGAIRRGRLLELVAPVPLFAFLTTVHLDVLASRYEGALRLCALAAILATLASAGRMHEPLFKDYRLVTAREPEAWLAGEPA